MDPRIAVARTGEDAAAGLYRAKGFRIVERNFRCRGGEIDVIARRGRLVVFCEVKTRTSARFGLPAEAVDARKQARIRRCAASWLALRRPGRIELRFDVVSVIVTRDRRSVEHFPAAF